MTKIEAIDHYNNLNLIIILWRTTYDRKGKANKVPITKGWQNIRENNTSLLKTKLSEEPILNIGLKTGGELLVLDWDCEEGCKKLYELQSSFPELIYCPIATTPRGGRHTYHIAPKFANLTTGVNILPKVDFRCNGGFIACPPSENYEWLPGSSIEDCDKTPLSDELFKLLFYDFLETKRENPYPNSVIDQNEIIPEGRHNNTIFDQARLLRDSGIEKGDAIKRIWEICKTQFKPPLHERSDYDWVIKTINSAYKGMTCKRNIKMKETNMKFNYENPLKETDVPKSLWTWTLEIAQRKNVCHEMVLLPSFTAIAGIINSKVEIKVKQKDPWSVPLNLWTMIMSPPSNKKSPVLSDLTYIIKKIQEIESDKYLEALIEYRALERIIKNEIAEIERKFKEKLKTGVEYTEIGMDGWKKKIIDKERELICRKPHEKIIIPYDVTIQKLAEILSENPYGCLVYNDELPELFDSFGQKSKETDKTAYNKLWDGKQQNAVRRKDKSHENIYIPKTSISILGAIPTSKLQSFLDMDQGGDGFFQRFQLVMNFEKREEYKYIDIVPDDLLYQLIDKIFKKIYEIPDKKELQFNLEAQEVYKRYEAFINEKVSGAPNIALGSYFMKCQSLMPRIAGLIHEWNWGESTIMEDSCSVDIREALMGESVAKRILEFTEFSYLNKI